MYPVFPIGWENSVVSSSAAAATAVIMTEQWEALELTVKTLNEYEHLDDPLPTRLRFELLPRYGVWIVNTFFKPSHVYPGKQRVCDVEYVCKDPAKKRRLQWLKEQQQQQQQERPFKTSDSSPIRGTLESVVWNAVIFGRDARVPNKLRLCSVETMHQFCIYLYAALGYNHITPPPSGDALNNHRCFIEAYEETLHRSWEEFNFGRWDAMADLTTRYAKLRTLVPFPDDGFPDPVVVLHKPAPAPSAAAAAAASTGAPDAAAAAADGADNLVVKSFETMYSTEALETKKRYERGKPLATWGLGALAFFGTCNGSWSQWKAACDEAEAFFTGQYPKDGGAYCPPSLPVRLVAGLYHTFHFPEAMFGLARILFGDNLLVLSGTRDLVNKQVHESTTPASVADVTVELSEAALSHCAESPLATCIGKMENFGAALANNFWIDDALHGEEDLESAASSRPVIWVKLSFKLLPDGQCKEMRTDMTISGERMAAMSKLTTADFLTWRHAFDSPLLRWSQSVVKRSVTNVHRDELVPECARLEPVPGLFVKASPPFQSLPHIMSMAYKTSHFPALPRDPLEWVRITKSLPADYFMVSLDEVKEAEWLLKLDGGDHFVLPYSEITVQYLLEEYMKHSDAEAARLLLGQKSSVYHGENVVNIVMTAIFTVLLKWNRTADEESKKKSLLSSWLERYAVKSVVWERDVDDELLYVSLGELFEFEGFSNIVMQMFERYLNNFLESEILPPLNCDETNAMYRAFLHTGKVLTYDVQEGVVGPDERVYEHVFYSDEKEEEEEMQAEGAAAAAVGEMQAESVPAAAVEEDEAMQAEAEEREEYAAVYDELTKDFSKVQV